MTVRRIPVIVTPREGECFASWFDRAAARLELEHLELAAAMGIRFAVRTALDGHVSGCGITLSDAEIADVVTASGLDREEVTAMLAADAGHHTAAGGSVPRQTGTASAADGSAPHDHEALWAAVHRSVAWLDDHNGRDAHQITLRLLKVFEEAGEVASARIGELGQNPRKGVCSTTEEIAAELADVVITALVAIESLGLDSREVTATCAAKVLARIPAADGVDRG